MRVVILLPAAFIAEAALGQFAGSDILRQEMTTYVQMDVGSSTFESDAAESKETAETSTFSFATSAGFQRLVNFQLSSNRNYVDFALNDSSMLTHWRDLAVSYRLGWFYPSVIGSLTEIQVNRANGEFVDLYRGTVGGGLAFKVPMWNKILAFVDARHLEKPKVPSLAQVNLPSGDAAPEGTPRQLDATLGPRSELDLGASIDIAREYLDFVVGFRLKRYQFDIEEETQNEYQAGPYAGFRLGAYF